MYGVQKSNDKWSVIYLGMTMKLGLSSWQQWKPGDSEPGGTIYAEFYTQGNCLSSRYWIKATSDKQNNREPKTNSFSLKVLSRLIGN